MISIVSVFPMEIQVYQNVHNMPFLCKLEFLNLDPYEQQKSDVIEKRFQLYL